MFLGNSKGFHWNHKRVYRIYRDLELNLRIKPRKRIKRDKPEALSVPSGINQAWSMDFMSDSLKNGRSVRTFNVFDDFNRECLTIDVNFSLPTQRFIRPSGVVPHLMTVVEVTDAIIELIAAGFGIGILSRWAVQTAIKNQSIAAVSLGATKLDLGWSALVRDSELQSAAARIVSRKLAEWFQG
jgi:hypothetical protein